MFHAGEDHDGGHGCAPFDTFGELLAEAEGRSFRCCLTENVAAIPLLAGGVEVP